MLVLVIVFSEFGPVFKIVEARAVPLNINRLDTIVNAPNAKFFFISKMPFIINCCSFNSLKKNWNWNTSMIIY